LERIKVLVTGAGGQLGNAFRLLAGKYPDLEFILLRKEELSIADQDALKVFFNKHKPDWCVNTAAYTQVDKAESDAENARMINGLAVGFLASACNEVNAKLIHISTDYVFSGTHDKPWKETDLISPINMYGHTKALGEKEAMEKNPDTYVIRTSWLYGEQGNNFVKTMIRLMGEREQLGVVNDQFGSPTYTGDLAEAVVRLILSGSAVGAGVYHFSNAGVTTWYGFASQINELIHSKCKVNPVDTASYPTPAKRPAYSVLDTSKIRGALYLEIPDWKDSLKKYLLKENFIQE
jgi:dTDP-4-dehydrorhamnose reductase